MSLFNTMFIYGCLSESLTMTKYGSETSLYLQKDLEIGIIKALHENPDTFKSRNHFINCAIVRELRRLGIEIKEEKL